METRFMVGTILLGL